MRSIANVRNLPPVYGQIETISNFHFKDMRSRVCSLSSLYISENRNHRGVGWKNSVSRFRLLKLSNCYRIKLELDNDTYHTSEGDEFIIYEPKKRKVNSTKYKDRIPQTSFVLNFIYTSIVPNLIENNFACLKYKGVDRARERLKEMLKESSLDDYVLKVDLKDYFGLIEHDGLNNRFAQYCDDEWVVRYHRDVIDANEKSVGITLGNEINQLSAVINLDEIDHHFENDRYERYMDDIVYIDTKERVKVAYDYIKKKVESMNLKLSDKKTYFQPVSRPVKFLGFTFLLHQNKIVTMKRLPEKVNSEKRKLRRMKRNNVPIEKVTEHYRSVRATMKKGSRSGVVKMDRYFNNLFKGVI